jgi:hypothetical protein
MQPSFLQLISQPSSFAGVSAILLCVEGPMIDDKPWINAARHARDQFGRRVVCGPAGSDRNALAIEFQRGEKLAGVPPGSILRPRQ